MCTQLGKHLWMRNLLKAALQCLGQFCNTDLSPDVWHVLPVMLETQECYIARSRNFIDNTAAIKDRTHWFECNQFAFFFSYQFWRYANIKKQNGVKSIMDSENRFGICGDWFIKGTVESALLSSNNLIENISTHI